MNENEIKAEARLQAIEYMVTNLYARALLQQPDPNAAIKTGVQSMLSRFKGFAVPDIDPALSDHVTAELQNAIERLFLSIQEMVETELRRR